MCAEIKRSRFCLVNCYKTSPKQGKQGEEKFHKEKVVNRQGEATRADMPLQEPGIHSLVIRDAVL